MLFTGVVHWLMGEFDDAQQHLDRAEATFERCPGAYWEIGSTREFALWTLAYRGHLPELSQRLTAAVALCIARGDRVGALKLLAGPSRVDLLARDEPQQLLEACRMEPLGLAPDEYPLLSFCAPFGRANAFLYGGCAGDALAILAAARREIRTAHLLYCQFYRIEFAHLQGRAALARMSECKSAEHPRLITLTRRCVRALRRERAAWADALAATLDASLALLTTSREHAIARLHESAGRLDAAGLGSFASAVRWQLQHTLDHFADHGVLWHGAAVACPERLAHTLVPLPR